MSPNTPPLVWPDGIDPLISTDALFTAIACRSDACVIVMARYLGSQNVIETPHYSNGDALRCLGLTIYAQDVIKGDFPHREKGESA